MEVCQLVKGDLRPAAVPKEPPRVSENCCATNVCAYEKVSEKQPLSNQRFPAVPWGNTHDRMVGWIEPEGGCRKAVSD